MKISKDKLKQIVKEALEDVSDNEEYNEESPWKAEVDSATFNLKHLAKKLEIISPKELKGILLKLKEEKKEVYYNFLKAMLYLKDRGL